MPAMLFMVSPPMLPPDSDAMPLSGLTLGIDQEKVLPFVLLDPNLGKRLF
jgi:hypothetical protein